MAKTKPTKTLIEKSLVINGMGHPETKTIFQLNTIPVLAEDATEEDKTGVKQKELENEKILSDIRFKSLATISGRKLCVDYKYLDGEIETDGRIQLSIPFSMNQDEVKDFILSEINKTLI
jgi:hypothetical protein